MKWHRNILGWVIWICLAIIFYVISWFHLELKYKGYFVIITILLCALLILAFRYVAGRVNKDPPR